MFLYVNLREQLYMQVTNVRLQLYTYDTAFKKKSLRIKKKVTTVPPRMD